MKIHRRIALWLVLLALFAFNFQLQIACARDATSPNGDAGPGSATLKPDGASKTQAVPWNQIGAKAGADYQGDGLAVTPTSEGARLHCIFQRLDGEATTGGLWLASTVTNQTSDRFQVRAASVGRAATALPLADTGTVRVDQQTVHFERAGLVEEYGVSLDGVKQDFVVTGKPAGVGELEVRLAVTGARVETTAYGAQLVLAHSGRKIDYSRLRVTDATGKELSARIEVASGDRQSELAVVVNDAGAVYPVRIDPTFSDANWISMGGVPGVDGAVRVAVMDGSGNLYISGPFKVAGEVIANKIVQWNGSSWSALGSGVNGSVYALAVSGNTLYAGGFFTTAGGILATTIAQWNGSSWSALGSGTSGEVYALAVSGNTLYAGGQFMTAGGVSANSIAQWNGSDWSALCSGMNKRKYTDSKWALC